MEKIKTINEVFLSYILSEVMIDKIINCVSENVNDDTYNHVLSITIPRTLLTIGSDIKESSSKKF